MKEIEVIKKLIDYHEGFERTEYNDKIDIRVNYLTSLAVKK